MTEWVVYPAIDLRDGQVVRLRQGDPAKQKEYSQHPGQIAQSWVDAGAQWLHVINLDGAFSESETRNYHALETILASGARIQFGGGVRTLNTIERLLNTGVARVILGTAAVLDSDFLATALANFGSECVVLSVDLRAGRVAVEGWRQTVETDPLELARQAKRFGLRRLIVTDTQRDGEAKGINLELCSQFQTKTGLNAIAAGGARAIEDVRRSKNAGLAGVVLGRALYEGQISLQEALTC